jgi:type II secretory pathway pseudopilin PulG
MIDRCLIGIVLGVLLLALSFVMVNSVRIAELEKRVSALKSEIESAEKQSRLARQDVDFIIKLTTDKIAKGEEE